MKLLLCSFTYRMLQVHLRNPSFHQQQLWWKCINQKIHWSNVNQFSKDYSTNSPWKSSQHCMNDKLILRDMKDTVREVLKCIRCFMEKANPIVEKWSHRRIWVSPKSPRWFRIWEILRPTTIKSREQEFIFSDKLYKDLYLKRVSLYHWFTL